MDLDSSFKNPYITLFPRQKEIIQDLLKSQYGLLRGDQGTGKTVCAVFLVKLWLQLNLVKKVLIITRRIVIEKFKAEVLKYIPELTEEDIVLFNDKNRDLFGNEKGKIFICDYDQIKLAHKFKGGPSTRKRGNKTYKVFKDVFKLGKDWACVMDEIQACKNHSSDVHKVVHKTVQNMRACMACTGTPIEKVEEVWAIFRLLDENIISYNYFQFMNKIAVLLGDTLQVAHYREKGVKSIWNRVGPYIHQLYKTDIVIPVEKTIIDKPVEMVGDFKREYEWFKEGLRRQAMKGSYFDRKSAANLIHPLYKYIKRVDMSNPRFVAFDKILQRLIHAEKIVVWDNSPDIIQALQHWYQIRGIESRAIYGDVPKDKRPLLIEEFDKNEDIRILFISYLTTQDAWEIPSRPDVKRAIYYSLPDRAINYDQSLDRLHRLNSQEPVTIYRIILNGSIDLWARDLLDYKLKLMKGLISREDFKQIEDLSFARLWDVDKPKVMD